METHKITRSIDKTENQSKPISKHSILKLVILVDHPNSPKIEIEEEPKCGALWSLVVFDPDYDPIRNNVVTVFYGRFFETWSMEQI